MRVNILPIAMLALLSVAGCATQYPAQRTEDGATAAGQSAGNLRPGTYCVIDMVVPPTAGRGCYQCYAGTVAEVTAEEVVLKDVIEESWIDYGTSRRGPQQKPRGMVRVPLAGVAAVHVTDPPAEKTKVAEKSATKR